MKLPKFRDNGHLQTLEAAVVASIMLSAVIYVATFEAPPQGATPSRAVIAQQAADALSILYDTPVTGSNHGDNALSVYMAECMQGDCTNLERKFALLLPEGAQYALYISNGESTFPVYLKREPSGEAVSASRLIEPSWSSSFVAAATSGVDPSSESLTLYTLPIFNSNVLSQDGSPLWITVHGTRLADGSDYTLTAFSSTQAFAPHDAATRPAVSLLFVNATGAPLPVHDVRQFTMSGGSPSLTPTTFRLRLSEEAGVSLAEGVDVRVHVPRGWTAVANATTNAADWIVLSNATDPSGSDETSMLRARLAHNLTSSYADLVLEAVYHGDLLDYYPFQAELSRGALASATMVVRGQSHSPGSAYETPGVHVSVARPMGALATTTWTLSATLPDTDDGDALTDTLTVDRIEIVDQSGTEIFGDVEGIQLAGGTWENQNDRLVWTGAYDLKRASPLNLTFRVTGSGEASPAGERGPITPPVTFDSGNGKIVTRSAPGLFRGSFLPASDGRVGYNPSTGSVYETHTVASDTTYRTTALPGNTTHRSGLTNVLQDAIYGSYVNVETRSVPVGGQVVMTADVQSVLFALAQAGLEAGITVNFYPPWTGNERTPIWNETSLDGGVLSSDVTQIVLHDLNGDGEDDPIVGTSNGRIFALHALTGARFQGNTYTAPLGDGVEASASASIASLSLLDINGTTYIVAGTSGQGTGIIVLDTDFTPRWTYDMGGRDVIAVDSSTDITGDGQPDVLAAVAVNDASAVYLLSADPSSSTLTPVAPVTPVAETVPLVDGVPVLNEADVSQIDDAFYIAPGRASALKATPAIGADGEPGFVVTIQTIADADVQLSFDVWNPHQTQATPYTSLPRAGLTAVNGEGANIYTFFGSPVTKATTFDYDGDGTTDIVGGGPGGYVFMMNGTVATQPLYSVMWVGMPIAIDTASRSPFEHYILGSDGSVLYTDDGWVSTFCANCDPATQAGFSIPTARAIAVNATGSVWLAGTGNTLYRTDVQQPTQNVSLRLPVTKTEFMKAASMEATKYDADMGSPQSYSFTTSIHDFNDVHFRDGNEKDMGWVIGSPCNVAIVCDESLVMRTTNGGANWTIASLDDPVNTLADHAGGVVASTLNHIAFPNSGTGFIVGDAGTVLRSVDGGVSWNGVTPPGTFDVLDVHCLDAAPMRCVVVGEDAQAYMTSDALATPVAWTPLGVSDFAPGKTLYCVGFHDDQVGYIGTDNMLLRTHDGGASWTTVPLNYVDGQGRAISIFPDGSGYIVGGTDAVSRIWFLADYPTSSWARTVSLTPDLPASARILSVSMTSSNASLMEGTTWISAFATSDGSDWTDMGTLTESALGGRDYTLTTAFFDPEAAGHDLQLEFELGTRGDSTLYTPILREAMFRISYLLDDEEYFQDIELDFDSQLQLDAANTTAWWNPSVGALAHSIAHEYWVRNVSGAVDDIATGYDVVGDDRDDVWVATGGVLALNSPDYIIYAGQNKARFIESDNRIYLLDGASGAIVAKTESYSGNVTNLRISPDGEGNAERLFASTWDPETRTARLVALDPATLNELWSSDTRGEINDMETSVSGMLFAATATNRTVSEGVSYVSANGRTWSVDPATGAATWRAIPDDRGRYIVSTTIPYNWWFGPYVVEVEVSWEDPVTVVDGSPLLRSARVYDYFLVTPPDSLSPPSPIYSVHLVTWLDDWR